MCSHRDCSVSNTASYFHSYHHAKQTIQITAVNTMRTHTADTL